MVSLSNNLLTNESSRIIRHHLKPSYPAFRIFQGIFLKTTVLKTIKHAASSIPREQVEGYPSFQSAKDYTFHTNSLHNTWYGNISDNICKHSALIRHEEKVAVHNTVNGLHHREGAGTV